MRVSKLIEDLTRMKRRFGDVDVEIGEAPEPSSRFGINAGPDAHGKWIITLEVKNETG